MALSLPANYSSNLGQKIKEHYLVEIFNDQDAVGKRLSTHQTTVSSETFNGVITNIPAIRESIDLNKSKASLGNLSISCANDGLDDLLLHTRTYLNRTVKIYSQLDDENNLSNCLLIYQGILRAVQTTENKITLQVSSLRPFENINVPVTQSVQGNYVPIVFGNYTGHTFGGGFLGIKTQTLGVNAHPVPVETVKAGRLITLAHESDTTPVSTGYLHVSETGLFRTPGSENMTKAGGTLLNNETQTSLTAQDGSTTIFGRSAQLNLRRGALSLVGIADSSQGSLINDRTTFRTDISGSANNSVQVTHSLQEIGSIKHTPEAITLTLEFDNVNININNFSSYKAVIDVYWGSDSAAGVSNYQMVSRTVSGNTLSSIADISEEFVTNNVLNENTVTNDSDNSGGLPQRVDVKMQFFWSGTQSYSIDYDITPHFAITTQIDESSTQVQSASEIVGNVKELYSVQDGHKLSGSNSVITNPVEAHRYLCETFMPSNFSSTRPTTFTEIQGMLSKKGQMHYYIKKQKKLEEVLDEIQHFGCFIMRNKLDGSFEYISPSYLTTSTTVSTTKPYLKNIGTLQTVGGSGISQTDTYCGVDYTGSEHLSHGDIIAVNPTGLSTHFEFMRVYEQDHTQIAPPSGADRAFFLERQLIPSDANYPLPENAIIFKVMFPFDDLDDLDIANLQISHLSLDKIATKYKINYHRDPASNSNFLESKEFDNSENRTKYAISTENIKEVKNVIDVKGQLSNFYHNHYSPLSDRPRIQLSFDVVNPSFYGLEVGDIISLDGNNTTQKPFGTEAPDFTALKSTPSVAWYRYKFIVTSTTRSIGKISISAYEIM